MDAATYDKLLQAFRNQNGQHNISEAARLACVDWSTAAKFYKADGRHFRAIKTVLESEEAGTPISGYKRGIPVVPAAPPPEQATPPFSPTTPDRALNTLLAPPPAPPPLAPPAPTRPAPAVDVATALAEIRDGLPRALRREQDYLHVMRENLMGVAIFCQRLMTGFDPMIKGIAERLMKQATIASFAPDGQTEGFGTRTGEILKHLDRLIKMQIQAARLADRLITQQRLLCGLPGEIKEERHTGSSPESGGNGAATAVATAMGILEELRHARAKEAPIDVEARYVGAEGGDAEDTEDLSDD